MTITTPALSKYFSVDIVKVWVRYHYPNYQHVRDPPHIYMYIHMERERERHTDRQSGRETQRERERETEITIEDMLSIERVFNRIYYFVPLELSFYY